jgi:hypothetical protein
MTILKISPTDLVAMAADSVGEIDLDLERA